MKNLNTFYCLKCIAKELVYTFLFSIIIPLNIEAQNPSSPYMLGWDKVSCQNDDVSKLYINSSLPNGFILRVCENSLTTYRIFGEDMTNVQNVTWNVAGGTIETTDEFAFVKWDETYEGYLNFKITLLDGSVIERTITTRKFETDIALTWDKIGCQVDSDKVNEIKFSGPNSSSCLKVCKGSKIQYKLLGNDIAQLNHVVWTVTGGETETPESMNPIVKWNESSTGSIRIRMQFNTGSVIEKTFCVLKLDSSILLEWEKIEESSLREFKLDNEVQEKEVIMTYPESTVFYKISGSVIENIASINWEVHGGFAYIENGFATPITWFDEVDNYIVIHLTYLDGTTKDRQLNIIRMERVPGGGINAPTSIKFSYDDSGNQTRRDMIYLASRQSKPKNDDGNNSKKWTLSEYHNVSYYPNPVRSELYLKWIDEQGEDMTSIEIYDLSGRFVKIYEEMSAKEEIAINFDQYPQGIFTVILNYSGGETRTLKIVKQ